MAINFNTNPYHDDYAENKNFHRILFKPGVAVQARELTQLQTALQQQITRFGKNIFTEGSIVIPGQQVWDFNYKYVKLTTTYNSIDSDDVIADLVGSTITGQTTGVKAIVLNYALATDTDPPTIFVKYIDSGTSKESSAFNASEVFSNAGSTITLQVASSSATGSGSAFSVKSGVIFTKGNFVYFGDETYVVSKYSDTPTASVGFTITEEIVTSEDDSSLLDPAVGSFNYFAPGADRYKISLALSTRAFIPLATDDDNYIELSRVEGGVPILQKINPQYNLINDTLARRTYDESGNYVVRPYKLEAIEHLRTSNTSIRDGLYSSSEGGNADLFVGVINPGKAYVLGYEVENIKSQYLIGEKARDSVDVNNSTVSTETGNYLLITGLYSIPDIATLSEVSLYNGYTASNGSSSGTLVGTARIRALEYYSGSGATAVYKAYLFDISMSSGYVFERDVKQIYFNNAGFPDFTANINPTFVTLTGAVATTNASNVIAGTGTRFLTELKAGDFITINSNISKIETVLTDVSAYASTNLVGNVAGITASRHQANILIADKSAYIFEFPYSTIKTVDSTGLETSYNTRRVYDRTLTLGNVSITAGTDETFAPYSADNYILVDKSDGSYVDLTGKVTRSGSPTGKTITFTLGVGLGSNDVRIITTVQKSNSAATQKNKTLVSGSTVDFTANTTATATVLSLGQADIYALANVKMSANAFGTAYLESNAVDITDRYTLDNGQRKTHYDIGTLSLKPGSPVPTGPIRVTFDYFTHSSGDYFSVESYNDISYENIPSFVDGSKTYKLRDCLDFRPRIDTNGTTFTSPSEFLDGETDLQTDYSYYIPRTDKIVIDSNGLIKIVKGVSAISPVEPATPANSMALFVLKQNPYVFNVKEDIDVTVIDNKRYTMRDIGRIENRVKNLEYYTTLSLLEKDTSLYQIKDSLGFDRFKNGFIVDNFTGHKVGNDQDTDYSISMDIDNGILRPLFTQKNLYLNEISSTTGQRTANNYSLTGNIASLPYTQNVFVECNATSRVENINPFSVINFVGDITLDPPADIWFDDTRVPDIYIDVEGNYNTLLAESKAKGTYGTVWGSWQSTWYGSSRTETREGVSYSVIETIDSTTNNDVVLSKNIIPKMRSVVVKFYATGMKPNTKLQAYFNDYRVTDFCFGSINTSTGANVANLIANVSYNDCGNIFTDSNGYVEGVFSYDAAHFDFPTGDKIFRLTDSPTNSNDSDTSAEAIFTSSGELRTVRNEIVSTRNGYVTAEAVYDNRIISAPVYNDYYEPPSSPTVSSPPPEWGVGDVIAAYTDGVVRGSGFVNSYNTQLDTIASTAASVSNADRTAAAAFITADGGINPFTIGAAIENGSYVPSATVLEMNSAIKEIVADRIASGEYNNLGSGIKEVVDNGSFTTEQTINIISAQLTMALVAGNQVPAGAEYATAVNQALSNPANHTMTSTPGVTGPRQCWSTDPLAQTFIIAGNPAIISSVDLYFYAKDTNIPMFVEIRKVVNGIPTQTVVPFSRKTVRPSDITTSNDGSVATNISFDGLVYLDPGEYAIVLLTSSINYQVWISQIGDSDTITGKVINEQPFVGVLFKSQNASTWSEDQYQDLKFKLYRAVFNTNVESTIDFEFKTNRYEYKALGIDPLEAYPNSAVLTVNHPEHGMTDGATVVLNGLPSEKLGSTFGNIFGVNVAQISGVEFSVSNVKSDRYTIIMPAAANVTTVTRGGGNGITATTDVKFDAMFPAISYLEFAGTTVTEKAKVTETGYSLSASFTELNKGSTTELSTSATIPSTVNITNNLSGARPFTYRVTLATDNENLSPLVDMQKIAVNLISNRINQPTYSSENNDRDIITIARNSNIFFTNLSNTTGLISFVSTADKANVASIVKGTEVTVANSSVNSSVFRVLEVLDAGANLKVYGTVTTAAAANVITVTNGTKFIAEEAATGGSSLSKYITKQVDFINPSTSINVRFDISQPADARIRVYYKTKLIGETTNLQDKEYIEMSGFNIPTSLGGEFFEVEKQVDDLPQFSSLILKIVLQSTNTAAVPKLKNLRVIALE